MDETANPYALMELAPFLTTVLLFVLVVAFVLWLALFILNRIIDTSRDAPQERRWTLARHLTFGFTLLCLLVMVAIVQYTAFHRPYQPSQVISTHVHTP